MILGCVALAVSPASGWPGYKWEQWRDEVKPTRPAVDSPQAGHKDLVELTSDETIEGGRITSIKEWEAKRARIARAITALLGEPSNLSVPEPEAKILGEEKLADHVRRHIKIRTEPDDWIPAYLLIPNPAPPRPGPVILCIHQTVAWGKREPCGIEGDPNMALALELVRRGYVCLAPDMIGFGERIPAGAKPYHDAISFYKRHPRWSFMGKMIWDVSRCIDYLETLDFVDPDRIGSIGHSHGAYTTAFATAFEPRISAAAISCGFTCLRADPVPNRWSHLTALIPSIGLYLAKVEDVPTDWHEILSLIAPRPFRNWSTLEDRIFPNTDNLPAVFGQLSKVYGLYGSADLLSWKVGPGDHRFPREMRNEAYDFLASHLGGIGCDRPKPKTRAEWEQQRGAVRQAILRDLGRPSTPMDRKANPHASPPVDTADWTTPVGRSRPTVKGLSRETVGGYERRLIEYEVEPGDVVRAYLLVPTGVDGKRPGVLVFHQTTDLGKNEPVGLAGKPSLAFARDLAERGYVVLAPDSICAGERIEKKWGPFDTRGVYRRHPSFSAMGKMLYDGQRALDLLASRPEVDASRLGTIGHSLGAEEALFLAAFDERIKVAVASCGFSTFHADHNPPRWARDHWFVYMPRLRARLLRDRLPDWDFDDVIRLIAPRAYMNYATSEDEIFPEGASAHYATESARDVWKLYGETEKLVSLLEPGPHGINKVARKRAYRFIDEQLKPAGR